MEDTAVRRKLKLSAAALFRTAQDFMVVFSVLVIIYTATGQAELNRRYDVMLGLLGIFIACTAAARRIKSPVLLTVVGAAAIGASYFLADGTLDIVMFALAAAAGFLLSLSERKLAASTGRHEVGFIICLSLILVPFGLLLICSYLGWMDTARWFFTWTALYVPVSVGAWLNDRFELRMQRFENRTAQPVETIRGNMRGFVTLAIALTLLAALLMPFEDGKSVFNALLLAVASIIAAFIGLIGKFVEMFTSSAPEMTSSAGYTTPDMFPTEPGGSDFLYNIIVPVAMTAFLVYLVYRLVRLVVWLVRSYIDAVRRRKAMSTELLEESGDTVEKIDTVRNERRPLFASLSTDEQIRRCYRKTVAQTASRFGLSLSPTATPDEIAAEVAEHGADIAELTAIYKKARYCGGCSEEELREAKRLRRAGAASQ